MIRVTVTTNAGALAIKYAQASSVYARTLLKAMRQVERETIVGLKTSIGVTLGRRTGLMARRVRGRFRLTEGQAGPGSAGATLDLRVRSTVWYMRGHEEGAVRTPKTSTHLAIPLFNRQTAGRFGEGRDASNRLKARDLIAAPGRYGFSGTFTRDGIIFGRLLDHDQIVPMFALRRSITLRARHPHALTRNFMAPRVRELLGAATDEATRELVGTRTAAA